MYDDCPVYGNQHKENESCIETCPICGKVMRYRSPSNEWGMAMEPGYYECEDDYQHSIERFRDLGLLDDDEGDATFPA